MTAVLAGQKTPQDYYKLDRMLCVVVRDGGEIGCCGTCLDVPPRPLPTAETQRLATFRDLLVGRLESLLPGRVHLHGHPAQRPGVRF